MLIDHSKVWQEILIILGSVEIQNAGQVDTCLEILVDLVRVPWDLLSSREVRETFVDPLDNLLKEQTNIMHSEHIKDGS